MKNKNQEISKNKKQILDISENINSHISDLLKAKNIIKGTIYTQKKKCGNPNCKCASGTPHCAKILSCSYYGKTRLIPLTKYSDIELIEIEKQVKWYQKFRNNRAKVVSYFKQLITEINNLEKNILIEVDLKKGGHNGSEKK